MATFSEALSPPLGNECCGEKYEAYHSTEVFALICVWGGSQCS